MPWQKIARVVNLKGLLDVRDNKVIILRRCQRCKLATALRTTSTHARPRTSRYISWSPRRQILETKHRIHVVEAFFFRQATAA